MKIHFQSKLLMNLIIGLSIYSGVSVQAQVLSPLKENPKDLMNATFYGETKSSIQLYLKEKDESGSEVLVPRFDLPSKTILAIETEKLADAIKKQKENPTEVNFQYLNNKTNQTKTSKNGWVCDVKVVDVLDESIRSSEQMERQDYCLSIVNLRALEIMEGNGDQIRSAATSILNSENQTEDSGLQTLAKQMQEIREEQQRLEESGETEIAGPLSMVSPLKNCGYGCLVKKSNFGMRLHPVLKYVRLHKGVDFAARVGTPVASVHEGRILANRAERGRKGYKGYGLYVIVAHPGAKMNTLYAHLSRQLGKPGQRLAQGQVFAKSGATGIGTGPHLHFEIHPIVKGVETLANPYPYIKHLLKRK